MNIESALSLLVQTLAYGVISLCSSSLPLRNCFDTYLAGCFQDEREDHFRSKHIYIFKFALIQQPSDIASRISFPKLTTC